MAHSPAPAPASLFSFASSSSAPAPCNWFAAQSQPASGGQVSALPNSFAFQQSSMAHSPAPAPASLFSFASSSSAPAPCNWFAAQSQPASGGQVSALPNSFAFQQSSMAHSPAPAPASLFSFASSSSAPAPCNWFAAQSQPASGVQVSALSAAHAHCCSSVVDLFPFSGSCSDVVCSSEPVIEDDLFLAGSSFENVDPVFAPESSSCNIALTSRSQSASELSVITFNTLKESTTNDIDAGVAPGTVEIQSSERTESAPSQASTTKFEPKKMKTTSKVAQFYTALVVKCCCYVKEMHGFIGTHRRDSLIFKRVERALRDRSLYPLPADVKLKDLMSCSFFQGPDSDSEFKKYCESDVTPLTDSMIGFADRLFNNKFGEVRKILANGIISRFEAIVNKLNGNGKRSGYRSPHCLIIFIFFNILQVQRKRQRYSGKCKQKIARGILFATCSVQ
jgi:hypothetical protein